MIALETRDAYWANVAFIFTGLVLLANVVWRIVILPNLQRDHPTTQTIADQNTEQLELLQRAVHQLTQNGGKNDPATMPDVAHNVIELRADVAELKALFADHLTVADGDRVQLARLTADVEGLKVKP